MQKRTILLELPPWHTTHPSKASWEDKQGTSRAANLTDRAESLKSFDAGTALHHSVLHHAATCPWRGGARTTGVTRHLHVATVNVVEAPLPPPSSQPHPSLLLCLRACCFVVSE